MYVNSCILSNRLICCNKTNNNKHEKMHNVYYMYVENFLKKVSK